MEHQEILVYRSPLLMGPKYDTLDNDCDGQVDEEIHPKSDNLANCNVETTCVEKAFKTCVNGVSGDLCDLALTRNSDNHGPADPCAWVSPPGLDFDVLRHEVTYGGYRDCVAAGYCTIAPTNYTVVNNYSDVTGCVSIEDEDDSSEQDNYPLRCLTEGKLAQYCEWIGGTLPTEAQLLSLINVFGQNTCAVSNCGTGVRNQGSPAPVCSQETTPGEFSICDLGGNAYEMTSDILPNDNGRVCFDDYHHLNNAINICVPADLSRISPMIGGRCVKQQ